MERETHHRIMTVVAAIIVTAGIGRANAAAAAPTYTVTDLGTLGGTESIAQAVNNSRAVVGRSNIAGDGAYRAFLYNGTLQDLGTLGGVRSQALGINASGQITGEADLASGIIRGFRYDGVMHDLGSPLGGTGSFGFSINAGGGIAGSGATPGDLATHAIRFDGGAPDLGTLGGSNSYGYGINAGGMVTGASDIVGNVAFHAFLYDGVMHDLGTLGGSNSQGNRINDAGVIAGYSDLAGDATYHAMLYDGTMHDLGTLGGTNSLAIGINASGEVSGNSEFGPGSALHGFLYTGGVMYDLNDLIHPGDPYFGHVTVTVGYGLNDLGDIAGQACGDGTGSFGFECHAVLLTRIDVAEPGSLALLAVGGLSLACLRRRTRRRMFASVVRDFPIRQMAGACGGCADGRQP